MKFNFTTLSIVACASFSASAFAQFPPPPPVNGGVDSFLEVCDATEGRLVPGSSVRAAVYRFVATKSAWVSAGWYNFDAGSCANVNVGPNPGYVYVAVVSESPVLRWEDETNPQFCIDKANRFDFVNGPTGWNQSNCTGGTLGTVGGHRVDFAPGATLFKFNLTRGD